MKMKDMLKQVEQHDLRGTYAPKVDMSALARELDAGIEASAKEITPAPIPNMKDAVVQSFIDMGKNIAKSLREAGQFCYDQGVKRQAEYETAAQIAEKKGEYQAREAGKLIDDFNDLRNISLGRAETLVIRERVTHTPESSHGIPGSPEDVATEPSNG